MGKDDVLWSSIESVLSNLLSPHCYEELMVKQHFFDLGCNKLLLSKMLGYAILVGSLLVKVPQIVKIYWNKSGAGVSVIAETIMLAAIFGSMAYGYTSEFPLSAYGDAYFLYIQTILVILFVLYYQRKYLAAVTYLGLFIHLFNYNKNLFEYVFSFMHIGNCFNVSKITSISISWCFSWSNTYIKFTKSSFTVLSYI